MQSHHRSPPPCPERVRICLRPSIAGDNRHQQSCHDLRPFCHISHDHVDCEQDWPGDRVELINCKVDELDRGLCAGDVDRAL